MVDRHRGATKNYVYWLVARCLVAGYLVMPQKASIFTLYMACEVLETISPQSSPLYFEARYFEIIRTPTTTLNSMRTSMSNYRKNVLNAKWKKAPGS